jgi:hypothetical protein
MKPEVQNNSSKGLNPYNKKSFHLFSNVFKSGRYVRHSAADFISKQLLTLFANFYPLVKH